MSTNTNKRNQRNNNANNKHNRTRSKRDKLFLPENERLPLQQKIADFIASNEPELVLAGLSKEHRKYLHNYALKINVKTRSYGPDSNRVMRVTHPNRVLSLSDVRKLELSQCTREALANILPTLRAQYANVTTTQQQQQSLQQQHTSQQKQSRIRGEALCLGLGPRLVPPRANFINNALYRDKQELPIFSYQDEILKMLKQHSVIIVNGETGSGKTTQVPQYILADATRRNRPCRIVVTQPRRVAAVSVAHRVAEERGEQLGETVGYQIRMESRVCKTTNLIYTTSGFLLRSIMADVNDLFRKISHLIIDEIHERDKFTDFTLITVKEQLKRNKDLKVILMSATMDIKQLSTYFDDCPVLNVPGKSYDVKIYHLEDILYHTGFRTALMDKYLRSLTEMQQQQHQQKHIGQQQLQLQQQQMHISPFLRQENGINMLATQQMNTIDQFSSAEFAGVRLQDAYMQDVLDRILEQCLEPGRTMEELYEIFDQIQYYVESEGLPIDAVHTRTGLTSLMVACQCNCPKYVQFFLQRHANVHVRDINGLTAYDYAVQHADGICLSLLENSGGLHMQHQQQQVINQEDVEKQRLLEAYQLQFNDDYEVDHYLILSLLEGLYRSVHPGAIMVFLPGYNDIVQQRDLISSTLPDGTYRLCILHGQMDSKDQFEALQRHRVRKIILSTNIGQTSITIPDLAYIIDSGKVKMKNYDSISESSQLQSVWISQADANQRSGRAGRTQNGVCYRLYSLEKYKFMPRFCIPEFMRIPLTEICLYAKTLDANCNVQTYLSRALNPPSTISIQNAIRKLQMLQVFNEDESVTELGKHLVELPLDVQLGKCLLYSIYLKCFDPVLTIVAFHSIKDPFILPTDRAAQGQASFQRKSFAGQTFSDHLGILALHKAYAAVRQNRKRCRDFCNKYFLSQSAMEMFCATRRQISDLAVQKFRLGQHATVFNDDHNVVRYCLAAGFYPNVAVVDRKKNTLICGAEKELVLQRTSALNPPGMKNFKDFVHQLPHDWIVFFEKSRVARLFSINMNTVVSPVVIALQCGRYCSLDEDELKELSDDSDGYDELDGDDDEVDKQIELVNHKLTHTDPNDIEQLLANLTLNDGNIDQNTTALMAFDSWIKFSLPVKDAKLLLLLRTYVHEQFLEFLRRGQCASTAAAACLLQKVLSTLNYNAPTTSG